MFWLPLNILFPFYFGVLYVHSFIRRRRRHLRRSVMMVAEKQKREKRITKDRANFMIFPPKIYNIEINLRIQKSFVSVSFLFCFVKRMKNIGFGRNEIFHLFILLLSESNENRICECVRACFFLFSFFLFNTKNTYNTNT